MPSFNKSGKLINDSNRRQIVIKRFFIHKRGEKVAREVTRAILIRNLKIIIDDFFRKQFFLVVKEITG
jgi:hypothetical protein